MNKLSQIEKELLIQVAELHKIPSGAYSLRKNGESMGLGSTKDIEIVPKKDKSGIDIFVKPNTKGKSMHLPVIITEGGVDDLVYNDFYIGENSDVTIIAGCGIHNSSCNDSRHNGIHSFHLEKNTKVMYYEKHLGEGEGSGKKILNPTTQIYQKQNSIMKMETLQIGGVSDSVRLTEATLEDGAKLIIKENVLTTDRQTVKTSFKVWLKGKSSSADVISHSVAKDKSKQIFESNIIGENACLGHVECDGILLDKGRIVSTPKVDARSSQAELSHEAAIGKIAGEQLTKLMTLGLTEAEATELIINSFLIN